MSRYLNQVKTRVRGTGVTPQAEPIPGSAQVPNSAGGYAFRIDDWARLRRWLILGSEGATYYATERTLTAENASTVLRCVREDGPRAVREVVEISRAGRAPKNDPALLALALASSHGDAETRRASFAALPHVARTGTHLFHYAAYCDGQRGWGKGIQRAIGRWYNDRDAKDLGYQVIKYQQRDGWSHRDLLRKSHVTPSSEAHNVIYHWVAKQGWDWIGPDPHPDERMRQIWAFEALQRTATADDAANLIREYRLPREAAPTRWLSDPVVWDALLEEMPITALIRNLATLTRIGLVAPGSEATRRVVNKLIDRERLTAARVHPIALLAALKTYEQGHGERGRHTWNPVSQVVDALDRAFYLSFGSVRATGKRWLLAIDVSGSMDGGVVAGVPGLTPRLAAAAMSMITAAVEPEHTIVGFSAPGDRVMGGRFGGGSPGIEPIAVSPRQRLDDVVRTMQKIPMGGTDCSLPMLWALEKKVPIDVFAIYTDNETWFGEIHPSQALARYRQETGIDARLAVIALTPTSFSIADPDDPSMLDVVGFDTAAPGLISDFGSGRL